jgi:hypothetical protein
MRVGLLGALLVGCSSLVACAPAAARESCPTIASDCPVPPPSWKTDVQPLIQTYCIMCHSPGGTGISSADLTTYANVYAHRAAVLHQVFTCLMPKADASPPPPMLSQAQRETIVAWTACNAPDN